MAIYSVGRKRIILALLLSSVLLLTLDLRGNPVIDAVRDGFGVVLDPVESATGVVTNPIERAWHGITNYDDLEQENLALQEQVDRLIGTQAAAEAAVIEGKELQALYSLPSLSGIDTEVASWAMPRTTSTRSSRSTRAVGAASPWGCPWSTRPASSAR
jgi:rod shape-determining protein MreC